MARPGSSTSSTTRSHRTPTRFLSAGSFQNPVLEAATAGGVKLRELVADEFVTVLAESSAAEACHRRAARRHPRRSAGRATYMWSTIRISPGSAGCGLGQLTPETAGIV